METIIHTPAEADIWSVLGTVRDPEIPALSLLDMGMITKVSISSTGVASVTMTPTFIGCPAINVMKNDIYDAVRKLGFEEVDVIIDLETPWTSDRMNPEAKEKLEKFGIAPPAMMEEDMTAELLDRVRCPHCGSTDTTLRSSFGYTLPCHPFLLYLSARLRAIQADLSIPIHYIYTFIFRPKVIFFSVSVFAYAYKKSIFPSIG